MNKIALGHCARGLFHEMLAEYDKAIEAYKKCTELPNVWRLLALNYADIDDLENSITAFENAVENGDLKSVPWLVELLESHRPEDPKLQELKKVIEDGFSSRNIDIIFSLGNLQLVAGEIETALEIWSEFINQEHWMINRNIADALLTRFIQIGELIPAPLGPIRTETEAIEFFLHVNEKGYKEGEPIALASIGASYLMDPSKEQFKDFKPIDFFDSLIEAAESGNCESLIMALYFASIFVDEIQDDSKLLKLLAEWGISDLLEVVSYRQVSENLAVQYGATFNAKPTSTSKDDLIQAIFDRADAAAKSGDSLAEVGAWLEGIDLGDENCFHNLGVTLCNELGIVKNFMGSQGGEGHAWSPLAKGIGASEDRPGRGPFQIISRFLSSTQISLIRSKYGEHPSVAPEALKPGQAESLTKICDLFEKCGYSYEVLDPNLIAIPYGSGYGNYVILCELIDDDGKEMALIYTCILTSKFDKEGKPVSDQSGLTKSQSKLLEILIREQELIWPSTTMMDMGDVFKSLPQEMTPDSFINASKAKDFWVVLGSNPVTFHIEALPTKHEFEKLEFGYAIDTSLQSDHFESGIRGIVGSLMGTIQLIPEMHAESQELFDLVFGYQPATSFEYEENFVPYNELAVKGSRTAQAMMVYQEKDHEKRLATLVELSKTGMHVATRIMCQEIELTDKNIDTVAEWIMKESDLAENHPQIRNMLEKIAWAYKNFGDDKKARLFYEKAANLGSGNALSNLSWSLLATGEHDFARKVFEDSYYRIMVTRESDTDFEQAANARSNCALHLFALGASHDELRAIWQEEHFQGDHLESKFYPILLDHIEGSTEKVSESLSGLTSNEKKELIADFKELLDSDTWIAGIAKTSIELLSEEPKKKKGLFGR
jgi:tetratricopeptide (TPR) repeat protein